MSNDNDVIIKAVRSVRQFKYMLSIAVLLAVAANILPVWCIERVQPVEVFRDE